MYSFPHSSAVFDKSSGGVVVAFNENPKKFLFFLLFYLFVAAVFDAIFWRRCKVHFSISLIFSFFSSLFAKSSYEYIFYICDNNDL